MLDIDSVVAAKHEKEVSSELCKDTAAHHAGEGKGIVGGDRRSSLAGFVRKAEASIENVKRGD